MPQLLHVSLNATLQLVLCALVGVLLARKGLFTRDARRSLAKVIMWAMLPALLIASLGHEASPETVRQYLGVMLAVPVLVLCGFLAGRLLALLLRIPADLRPLVTAASTFGNASYVPLPFLAAICATTTFPDSPSSRRPPAASPTSPSTSCATRPPSGASASPTSPASASATSASPKSSTRP